MGVFMPPKELWESYSNRTVRPSVPLCPVHISYILWGRNSKFAVWMHLGMAKCRVPFLGHCDLDLDLWLSFYNDHNVRPSVPLRVRCISPIFFEVGIPNLMCGCILGWRSVAYHFQVTVTLNLTPDLVFRIIVSGAYLLYYLRYEFQIWCVDASWDEEVSRTIIGSLWPWTCPLA